MDLELQKVLITILKENEAINTVLNLEEEEFEVFAPIFLEELKTSFKSAKVKQSLVETYRELNFTEDKVERILQQLAIFIENEYEDISNSKKTFLKTFIYLVLNTAREELNSNNLIIPVEVCHEDAKIPTYANEGDAGLDVYALEDITLMPGETRVIPIGIKVAVPYGYELQVRPKSGRSAKSNIRVANTPGTIDAGYRDEVGIILENIASPISAIDYSFNNDGTIKISSILHGKPEHISKGEKIAQLVLNKISFVQFQPVENIEIIGSNRGGGFGSTGLK